MGVIQKNAFDPSLALQSVSMLTWSSSADLIWGRNVESLRECKVDLPFDTTQLRHPLLPKQKNQLLFGAFWDSLIDSKNDQKMCTGSSEITSRDRAPGRDFRSVCTHF